MRALSRITVVAAIILFASGITRAQTGPPVLNPVGPGGDDGGGGSCKVCAGAYDPNTQQSIVNCAEPPSGSWGTDDCWIGCTATTTTSQSGSCYCNSDGNGCLYIVVTG